MSHASYFLHVTLTCSRCVMSLIRGLGGKFPCPICMVPRDMQSHFSDKHPLRTSSQSQTMLNAARATSSAKERERQLKASSLRDIEVWCFYSPANLLIVSQNVFWKISFCDVYRALSFDRLHAHNAGLWAKHLWSELQFWVEQLGRKAAVMIDEKFVSL